MWPGNLPNLRAAAKYLLERTSIKQLSIGCLKAKSENSSELVRNGWLHVRSFFW